MWKYLLLITAFFCFAACQKDEPAKGTPVCIKDKIEEFSQNAVSKTVKRTEIQNRYHYWFNDDSRHWDGVEFILDENCDTTCSFCGECLNTVCDSIYADVEWEIIWSK